MGATCGSEGTSGPELDFDGNNADSDEVRERFIQAGQGHVFNGWGDMDEQEKARLIQECCTFDVNHVNQLYENLVVRPQQTLTNDQESTDFDTVESEMIYDKEAMSSVDRSTYSSIGYELIKDGLVGVVVLAGGSGSRIGFEGPKGKFDIGLPSKKSLFQILIERFFKVQMDAHDLTAQTAETQDGASVPVVPPQALKCTMFIMTSHENHAETVQFFKDNAYFGGQESNFVFFSQQMLPALDTNGKILLKSYCQMNLAPNGNGALFEALKQNPEIQRAISSYEYLQIIGVDNCLNKVLDPIQIGLTHKQQLQACLKSCDKRNVQEKVGVIGRKHGQYNVIESSEMPTSVAGQHIADGSLKFKHGHILCFVIRSDLLYLLASGTSTDQLYHKNFQKINHCDPETWEDIKPEEENGWKFMLFVHSFLPMVDQGKLGVLMANRETEFAPVKEANGPSSTSYGYEAEPLPDTPAFARRMVLAEATKWLAGAEVDGLRIAPETKGKIEVSFLLSYGGENLNWLKQLYKRKPISGEGGFLNHEGEYTEVESSAAPE